ncbi:TM2 domain-containing protein [Dehalogenimonas formicexedens]|nr:TM2 domain-containing protein [Dehalogenimonas formicexedens]
MPFCARCGTEISETAKFCKKCGTMVANPITEQSQPPTQLAQNIEVNRNPPTTQFSPKSKIAAGLLGIFLGGLGIHRFYLGYTGFGIAQIAVTVVTLGIGGIWGFIEGILILTGTFKKDAKGLLLKD